MNATEAPGPRQAERARDCLHGLALGDAFGQTWFRISAGEAERRQSRRAVPHAHPEAAAGAVAVAVATALASELVDMHEAASTAQCPHKPNMVGDRGQPSGKLLALCAYAP